MPIMPVGKKNKSQVNGSQIYNEIQKAIIHEDKKDIKKLIELLDDDDDVQRVYSNFEEED